MQAVGVERVSRNVPSRQPVRITIVEFADCGTSLAWALANDK